MIAVRHAAHLVAEDEGGEGNPVLIRRRRTVLVLCASAAVAGVIGLGTGDVGAWAVFALVVATGTAYLGLLHRARRAAMERAFSLGTSWSWGTSFADLESLSGTAAVLDHPAQEQRREPGAVQQAVALTHFALASFAGWALSPLVFALTVLIGEKPKDTTGQRWLANLQAAQERLREQSWRTIAVSAATTASVTAVGTMTALGGAATASAAPLATRVSVPTNIGNIATPAATANYRIVTGDTLSGIAARFGTTTAALASANHIANPNLIFAGQTLVIPAGGAEPARVAAASSPARTYTVVSGDNLSSIAARFGTTTAALAAANHLANPNLIFPGQVLTLQTTAVLTSAQVAAPPAVSRPATAPPQAAASTSSRAQTAVQVALAQVGKPYQWAGAGPSSFDCSGLVMYAWAHAGVSLPHYSVAQYQDTIRVSQSQLQPGDLVFYDTGSGAEPGHVTIYVGNGKIVTADSPGTVVRVEALNWDGTPMGFGRVG